MDRVILDNVWKQVKKLPSHVKRKLLIWVDLVEEEGLNEARKIPGHNDEALKGNRKGQRSIRLSRSYRAIYHEEKDGTINLVVVEEVNKHEY